MWYGEEYGVVCDDVDVCMGKAMVWYLRMYGEGYGVVLEDIWGRLWCGT